MNQGTYASQNQRHNEGEHAIQEINSKISILTDNIVNLKNGSSKTIKGLDNDIINLKDGSAKTVQNLDDDIIDLKDGSNKTIKDLGDDIDALASNTQTTINTTKTELEADTDAKVAGCRGNTTATVETVETSVVDLKGGSPKTVKEVDEDAAADRAAIRGGTTDSMKKIKDDAAADRAAIRGGTTDSMKKIKDDAAAERAILDNRLIAVEDKTNTHINDATIIVDEDTDAEYPNHYYVQNTSSVDFYKQTLADGINALGEPRTPDFVKSENQKTLLIKDVDTAEFRPLTDNQTVRLDDWHKIFEDPNNYIKGQDDESYSDLFTNASHPEYANYADARDYVIALRDQASSVYNVYKNEIETLVVNANASGGSYTVAEIFNFAGGGHFSFSPRNFAYYIATPVGDSITFTLPEETKVGNAIDFTIMHNPNYAQVKIQGRAGQIINNQTPSVGKAIEATISFPDHGIFKVEARPVTEDFFVLSGANYTYQEVSV